MNGTSRFELTTPVLRRFSAIELLVALVALFVSFPFVERFPSGALIESILLTLVLVSAVFAIEGRDAFLQFLSLARPDREMSKSDRLPS